MPRRKKYKPRAPGEPIDMLKNLNDRMTFETRDHPLPLESGTVTVHFRQLEDRVIDLVGRPDAHFIVGCVAWLSSPRILKALANVPAGVQFIIQKEDFLRPDAGDPRKYKPRLRELYDNLPAPPGRWEVPGLVGKLGPFASPALDPVRCAGNRCLHRDAYPRMHHKFLVLCRVEGGDAAFLPRPHTVWTGSYNFTNNGGMSLENAVIIEDRRVAAAYFAEWSRAVALSEPLDWQDEWCAPQWRFS